MGAIVNLFVAICFSLAILFSFSSLFTDACAARADHCAGTETFSSFNKTAQMGSYMQNTTDTMRNNLANDAIQNNNQLSLNTLANVIGQSVGLAATGLFSIVDISFSIIYDLGGVIGIPGFFLGLLGAIILIKVGSAISEALRLGRF